MELVILEQLSGEALVFRTQTAISLNLMSLLPPTLLEQPSFAPMTMDPLKLLKLAVPH